MSTPTLERDIAVKAFAAPEITNAETGEVEAVVQTLGVVDRDREFIPIDALPSGVAAKISLYDHDSIRNLMFGTGLPDDPPVGKGMIFVEGNKVVFRGKYFMETQRGREAFLTFKAIGADQEWSFGYRILKSDPPTEELRAKGARRVLTKLGPIAGAFEVSPVPMGGGLGTRTVAMKCAGGHEHEGDVCETCTAAEAAAKAAGEQAARDAEAAAAADAQARADIEAKAQADAKTAAVQKAEIDADIERFERTRRRLGF